MGLAAPGLSSRKRLDMIPQQFPLYAIDTRDRKAYIVVGWRTESAGRGRAPFLAPHDAPGGVRPVPSDDLQHFVYGIEPPTRPPIVRIVPPDETVVLKP